MLPSELNFVCVTCIICMAFKRVRNCRHTCRMCPAPWCISHSRQFCRHCLLTLSSLIASGCRYFSPIYWGKEGKYCKQTFYPPWCPALSLASVGVLLSHWLVLVSCSLIGWCWCLPCPSRWLVLVFTLSSLQTSCLCTLRVDK